MITDLFDKNIVRILTLFSISPGSKFTRNEIKEKTMLNNVPLDQTLNVLLNDTILVREKRFYSLNFENSSTKNIINLVKKEYLRFKEIPLRIYFAAMDISANISDIIQLDSVYLFGSFAKLIYTNKSDIDLAIILKKEDKKMISKIKKILNKLEKKYNKTIEEHFFETKDLKQRDPLIKEIKRGVQII